MCGICGLVGDSDPVLLDRMLPTVMLDLPEVRLEDGARERRRDGSLSTS